MFKKNIAYLFLLVAVILFSACEKDMSPDDPLPAEREQTVFITTNSNRLFGYDALTGAKTWEKSLNGKMTGSPVISNDKLFVISEDGTFYVWDLKTKNSLVTKSVANSTGLSLAAGGGFVYMTGGNQIFCYDEEGTLIWNYNGSNPATTGVTLANGRLYAGFGGTVHCVDLNGTNIWTSAGFGDVSTTIKANGSNLYFGDDNNKMYAINSSNGGIVWSYTTQAQVQSSPLVYGGMSISGSDDNHIYCVDMIAGAGQQGLMRWKVPTAERVQSSPAIHVPTNTVLVGCHDFYLYAVDHVSGTLKWKYPTGSLITSSPVVQGNYAYFASYDKYLYCVDVRTGNMLWKSNLDYSADGSPVVDNITTEHYSGESGMSTY